MFLGFVLITTHASFQTTIFQLRPSRGVEIFVNRGLPLSISHSLFYQLLEPLSAALGWLLEKL